MIAHRIDSTIFVVKIQRVYIVLFMKKLRQKKVKSFVQEMSLWKQEFCKNKGMLYSSSVHCPMLIMVVFSMELPAPLLKQCFRSATGIVSKALCPIGHLEVSLLFLPILTLSSQIVLSEGHHPNRQGAIGGCTMSFMFVFWMRYTFSTVDFYL